MTEVFPLLTMYNMNDGATAETPALVLFLVVGLELGGRFVYQKEKLECDERNDRNSHHPFYMESQEGIPCIIMDIHN